MFADADHAGGPRALRRHARAARLRRRERHLAQLLPLRRHRAARGQLRHPDRRPRRRAIVAQLTPEQLFDALAISVDGPKAWDLDLAFDVTFTDLGTQLPGLTLRNGVLIYVEREPDPATPMQLT